MLGHRRRLWSVTTTSATARIVEIDINIVDPSLAVPVNETYAGYLERTRTRMCGLSRRGHQCPVAVGLCAAPGVGGPGSGSATIVKADDLQRLAIFDHQRHCGRRLPQHGSYQQQRPLRAGAGWQCAAGRGGDHGRRPAAGDRRCRRPVNMAAATDDGGDRRQRFAGATTLAPGSPGAALTAALTTAVAAAAAESVARDQRRGRLPKPTMQHQLASEVTQVRTWNTALEMAAGGAAFDSAPTASQRPTATISAGLAPAIAAASIR